MCHQGNSPTARRKESKLVTEMQRVGKKGVDGGSFAISEFLLLGRWLGTKI